MRATAVDYSFGPRGDKVARGERASWRPPDWPAVEDLLQLLTRAVQQLHTYPAASPLCVSAIDACQRALAALEHRDGLAWRVAPSELLVDDIPTGRGTQVEHELARRLHRAGVAAVSIDRAVSARELSRFCGDLLRCGDPETTETTLEGRLADHGVDRISVRMAYRPEVLDVGATPAPVADLVCRERARRESQLDANGAASHLYPPDKGWVRLDPASAFTAISLADLALVVEDPAQLAGMLLRLTDEAPEGATSAAALEEKYSDVAMLFGAFEPALARRLFARLSRAVLDLDPDRRQALLRRTILPGLLDGRVDGAVLRDFPDVELADSLCLLLDLETAAPEMLTTALARLDLPADRRAAMVPLLEARLRDREALSREDGGAHTTVARHARELLRVEPTAGRNFAEFEAFDLSLDARTVARLGQIGDEVLTTDVLADQLACLWQLVRLEPNPETVQRFVERALDLLAALERAARSRDLAGWLAKYRDLAETFRETRPDVTDVLDSTLATFCTPERAAWVVDVRARGADERALADAMVDALGPALVPPLVALLRRARAGGSTDTRAAWGVVAELLSDHAARLAPAIEACLDDENPAVRRVLVRALGLAGPGYESAVARHIRANDEATGREALRALARICTPEAAAAVAAAVEGQQGWIGSAAEETLWRLPRADAARPLRDLLGKREFVLRHPKVAARLLDRAAQMGAAGLGPVLVSLAPMRFRFWSPAIARVGRKARALLHR